MTSAPAHNSHANVPQSFPCSCYGSAAPRCEPLKSIFLICVLKIQLSFNSLCKRRGSILHTFAFSAALFFGICISTWNPEERRPRFGERVSVGDTSPLLPMLRKYPWFSVTYNPSLVRVYLKDFCLSAPPDMLPLPSALGPPSPGEAPQPGPPAPGWSGPHPCCCLSRPSSPAVSRRPLAGRGGGGGWDFPSFSPSRVLRSSRSGDSCYCLNVAIWGSHFLIHSSAPAPLPTTSGNNETALAGQVGAFPVIKV